MFTSLCACFGEVICAPQHTVHSRHVQQEAASCLLIRSLCHRSFDRVVSHVIT